MATLNWIGKDKVVNHHLDVPFCTLKHKYTYRNGETLTDGTRSENKIIHGDNLEALKSLLPEYEGKIKCIYIDPPYNTGNEGWVYNDNVNHPKIRKWLGEVVGREGEDLTRHDKWLCMMYPRLKLLHKLLKDEGVIFVSIDDNEVARLKLMMDEIFGHNNFISQITVITNPRGSQSSTHLATVHEYILVYAKSQSKVNMVGLPKEESIINEYKLIDPVSGRYRLLGLRQRGGEWKMEHRPNMHYPIYINPGNGSVSLRKDHEYSQEVIPKRPTGELGRWTWSKSKVEEEKNYLVGKRVKNEFGWDIFRKDYLLSKEGLEKTSKVRSVWDEKEMNYQNGRSILKTILKEDLFDYPKPIDYIQRCISLVTSDKDIILDSFAGSGTTAHAVLNLNKENGGNRKFVLIELEDYADSITSERVSRVIEGYGDGNKKVRGTGGDFEFLELADPLFNEDGEIDENQPIEEIRKYVYYSETRTHLGFSTNPRNEYYLGKKNGVAYYFYYQKDSSTTLDRSFINSIEIKADHFVIFADRCVVDEEILNKLNIAFKKIPRDITRI